MSSANDLTRLVPGFDFLQGLMKTGGAGLPSIGQWIAPTLDPAELQRRIDELRTVQFWLEQNAKLIGTTIQALEVQRMTLATLKGMNMPLADLAASLKVDKPAAAAATSTAASSWNSPFATGAAKTNAADCAAVPAKAEPAAPGAGAGTKRAGAAKASKATAPAVDPMQWWGALTQQFTELATQAMKDSSSEMARSFAGTAMKQGVAAANNSIERAMSITGKAAGLAVKAGGSAAKAGGAAAGVAVKRVAGAAAKRRRP
jgi:hypothetical protein